MPPKPRQTIAAPTITKGSASSSSPSAPTRKIRRKRWVHSPPTLILLLLLQPICLILGFILLTEPCLNPHYTNNLRSKFGYFSLLSTPGIIPENEWKERFTKAGVRGLFGVGVIQVWFVARVNGYILNADREYGRILKVLRFQREKGVSVGVDTRYNDNEQEQEGEERGEVVGSFVRQLEAVALTILGLPFIWIVFYTVVVLVGAPVGKNFKGTAIVAAYLSLLVGLPLVHVLDLPFAEPTTTTTINKEDTTNTTSTTTLTNTTGHWKSILNLKPNPTFLLPLYYPPIFTLLGTALSTAVLALDWGVSWQTYPFPLLVGGLGGLVFGDVFTIFVVLFG